jgi:hypothetical protein
VHWTSWFRYSRGLSRTAGRLAGPLHRARKAQMTQLRAVQPPLTTHQGVSQHHRTPKRPNRQSRTGAGWHEEKPKCRVRRLLECFLSIRSAAEKSSPISSNLLSVGCAVKRVNVVPEAIKFDAPPRRFLVHNASPQLTLRKSSVGRDAASRDDPMHQGFANETVALALGGPRTSVPGRTNRRPRQATL